MSSSGRPRVVPERDRDVSPEAPVGAEAEGVADRVKSLVASLSLEEKLAQLVGMWVDPGTGVEVAPLQGAMQGKSVSFEEFAAHGIGHISRFYGTAPVEPSSAARILRERQRWLIEHTRPGIPAIVHEECLTGLAAWQATTFPAPLCWGASFDPEIVQRMGRAIGDTMQSLGVHQGLAPVLDVVRDARWGRVEECISEDPYVVGSIATSYVRGLQDAGVVATLKHFVGYSASRAGRNMAPAHVGPRELHDVLLIPFEMAVLDGHAGSVLHSYAEIDGMPVAADPALLTDLLRTRWGFDGTVVADYFGVAFLVSLHRVAENLADAAAQALAAGVDVELPTGNAYLEPLAAAVRAGDVPASLVDRAVERVLRQKADLGLLDERFEDPFPVPSTIDPSAHRLLAAQIAEEAVILLANDGTLPLISPRRVAVIGPNAHRSAALFGCYSFANHVLDRYPELPLGIEVPTVLDAIRTEYMGSDVSFAEGCGVDDPDLSGIDPAVAAALNADVAILVMGDRAGLFGRGTSGEGCDAANLELPGVQRQLVEAVLDTGTPVILVLVTGRPYAIDWALDRCAGAIQAFFPGEEGGAAIAGVIAGRVCPSGRLPVSLPRSGETQPSSYLRVSLEGPSSVSNIRPEPALPFGHGLSYTTFVREAINLETKEVATDGRIVARVRVSNVGACAGSDVVQLYAHDPVASITRPEEQLIGYARVRLDPGASAVVRFSVPTARLAFSGRDLVRAVEPGSIEIWTGSSCAERDGEPRCVELVGPRHPVTAADARLVEVEVQPD
jgi:beta-glucosidase